mgnify:CR=1 FL=1
MKNYQKAEMIAKNLPTGSYAAGCPTHTRVNNGAGPGCTTPNGQSYVSCAPCEIAQ